VADPLSRAPRYQPEGAEKTPRPAVTSDSEHSVNASKFTVWKYPGNPDEGDETFHGSREANEFAKRCDEADNLLDNFPVSRLITRPIAAASRLG
jgi:hypothetical protein